LASDDWGATPTWLVVEEDRPNDDLVVILIPDADRATATTTAVKAADRS
jgi:hypothetical protein